MGQKVTFTVDAFPEDVFHGKVIQIRLNATMHQNVVTYTVVVSTDNSGNKLLPYMTANASFQAAVHKDVLRVPNAALCWQPRLSQVIPDARQALLAEASAKKAEGGSAAHAGKRDKQESSGRLWIPEGGLVRPVDVHVGISDGLRTEVSGPDLKDNMEVVVGQVRRVEPAGSDNPFARNCSAAKSRCRGKRRAAACGPLWTAQTLPRRAPPTSGCSIRQPAPIWVVTST